MAKKERTKVLGGLGAVMAALVIALVIWRHSLIVPWWAIAVVIAVFVVFDVALRRKPKTWGKERPVIDWWSVPHYLTGVLFGLFGIGLAWLAAAAVAWEGVELVSRVKEYPTNRVADFMLAVAGWITAMLIGGGAFPMT